MTLLRRRLWGHGGSMTLTPPPHLQTAAQQAEEFRVLVRDACGIDLDPQVAWRRARQLIDLYRMLQGPIPEDPAVQTSRHLTSTPVDTPGVVE